MLDIDALRHAQAAATPFSGKTEDLQIIIKGLVRSMCQYIMKAGVGQITPANLNKLEACESKVLEMGWNVWSFEIGMILSYIKSGNIVGAASQLILWIDPDVSKDDGKDPMGLFMQGPTEKNTLSKNVFDVSYYLNISSRSIGVIHQNEKNLQLDEDFFGRSSKMPNIEWLETQIKLLKNALDWLSTFDIEYYKWVLNAIKNIVLLPVSDQSASIFVSESSISRPSIILFGAGLPDGDQKLLVYRTAEQLVHEASHQYFMMLQRLYPVVVKGCTEKLYSSLALCDRPLERVLLAFHAAANFYIMYARAEKNRRLVDRFDLDAAAKRVLLMRGDLCRSVSLSDVGRALFEQIHIQLIHYGLP